MDEKPEVLLLGLSEESKLILNDILTSCQILEQPATIEGLNEPMGEAPMLVLCAPLEKIPLEEFCAKIHEIYPGIPVYLVCASRAQFDRRAAINAGFADSFLLPLEANTLRAAVGEIVCQATAGEVRYYRPVSILDLSPDEPLPFDVSVFLPKNNKYIRLIASGDAITHEKIDKLRQHKVGSVFVRSDQVEHFYRYSAEMMKKLSTTSSTEAAERLQSAVRSILCDLFTTSSEEVSETQSKNLTQDCEKIVHEYISSSVGESWYERLKNLSASANEFYSHSTAVSTLSTLLCLGLKIGSANEVAVAAMLHDLGMVDVPAAIAAKNPETWTKEEREKYFEHADQSVKLITQRKMLLSSGVLTAVRHHHEYFDGSGPQKIREKKLSGEAQILGIADAVEEMISLEIGKTQISYLEAFQKIIKSNSEKEGSAKYDPELIKALEGLMTSTQAHQDAREASLS